MYIFICFSMFFFQVTTVMKRVQHTHNASSADVAKANERIKDASTLSREKTSTLLSQALLNTDERTRAQMSRVDTISRRIRSFKRGAVGVEDLRRKVVISRMFAHCECHKAFSGGM